MQASFSGRAYAAAPCPARARRAGPVHVVGKGNQFDASARIKGSARRVFKYVSDLTHLPAWYPGVTSVTRTRGEGIELKNQYTVERVIMRMQHTSTYELIDLVPGRKVIYSAMSPVHTSIHEMYFMEDPSDRSYTNVRYIKRMQLRGAASALQPFVLNALSKVPQEGLHNVARLCIGRDTPLRKIKLTPEEEEAELRAAKAAAARSTSAAGGGGGAWSWQSVWDGLGGLSMGSSPPAVDALGYYAILGLDVRRTTSYGPDDIKAAYRAKAMEMHPDKVSVDDSGAQQVAAAKFQRLQKAYAVLKDPQNKRAYDAGDLLKEMV